MIKRKTVTINGKRFKKAGLTFSKSDMKKKKTYYSQRGYTVRFRKIKKNEWATFIRKK